MEDARPFDYPGKPLQSEDSFRLLELQSGQNTDPVLVRLLNCTIDNHPTYDAVSYAWGDPLKRTELQVIDDDLGVTDLSMVVTVNCEAALRGLRQPDAARILWVDAICIDQGLISERNHQLSIMAKIYEKASRVVIYLGLTMNGSDVVMDWIRQVSDAPDYGEPDTFQPPAPPRESIKALLERPWFHRVWVLQEVSLGANPLVICGDRTLPWTTFRHLRHAIIDAGSFVDIPYSFKYPQKSPDFLSSLDFVSYTDRLWKMLRSSRHCQATDPRDKVYAILPLLDKKHEVMLSALDRRAAKPDENLLEGLNLDVLREGRKVEPDYNLSAVELYTHIAKEFMKSVGPKEVLRSIQTPCRVPGLPSWVPDWSVTRFTANTVTRNNNIHHWRSRAVETRDNWRISDYSSPTGQGALPQLHLRGVNIGVVTKLGDVWDNANNVIPIFEWWNLVVDVDHPEELQPRKPEMTTQRLDQFWETLGSERRAFRMVEELVIATISRYVGRGINGNTRASRYLPAVGSEEVPITRVIDEWPYDSVTIRAKEILKGCDGFRFFLTDTGKMGLVPGISDVEVGDSLYTLENWNIPFVLRGCSVLGQIGSDERAMVTPEVPSGDYEELGHTFTVQAEAYGVKYWTQRSPGDDCAEQFEEILFR